MESHFRFNPYIAIGIAHTRCTNRVIDILEYKKLYKKLHKITSDSVNQEEITFYLACIYILKILYWVCANCAWIIILVPNIYRTNNLFWKTYDKTGKNYKQLQKYLRCKRSTFSVRAGRSMKASIMLYDWWDRMSSLQNVVVGCISKNY